LTLPNGYRDRAEAAFTIARMPALTASGSPGQADIIPVNSGCSARQSAKQDAKTFSQFAVIAGDSIGCVSPNRV
jgi:hypothetical protein